MNTPDRSKKIEQLYSDALRLLVRSKIPFMVGGALAYTYYTEVTRELKDLDLFCKAGDYLRLLKILSDAGYKTELTDERWLGKAYKGEYYVDLIFNSASNMCPVDDTWFRFSATGEILGVKVKILPTEEMLWSKAYVHNRLKYDGADISHLILKQGKHMDWKRILRRMEAHWEILLAHILNYRFIYPSERDNIPRWLLTELVQRLAEQLTNPPPQDKVCRGPLLARDQYDIDREWGFKIIE